MADYDSIAQSFQQTCAFPFRWHSEAYTYLNLIGPVQGLSILDLACGDGIYSRHFKSQGAARVVGVDISAAMIDLARSQQPDLEIEYYVADVAHLEEIANFDLVVASYLLNHAADACTLGQMARAIAENLKPGGKFISVNNHLEQDPASYDRCLTYNYRKQADLPLEDGRPIHLTFYLPDGSNFTITDYYLSQATYEQAFAQAGFQSLEWCYPQVSAAGIEEFGQDYWQDFLRYPPIILLKCQL